MLLSKLIRRLDCFSELHIAFLMAIFISRSSNFDAYRVHIICMRLIFDMKFTRNYLFYESIPNNLFSDVCDFHYRSYRIKQKLI